MTMPKNVQRLSQLVSTFGPGSMVDLPTRSVVIGGLEHWDMRANNFTVVHEPRLAQRLETLLLQQQRLAPDKRLTLRTPPVSDDDADPKGVAAPIFPTWFVCERVETTPGSTSRRRRRLVRWDDLDTKDRRRYVFDDGSKSDVTPIRFVAACETGHLQDIDWRWVVHGRTACSEPMWMEEKGTSADPADTSVVCGCGKSLSLQDAFQPGRLGVCRGERPWLLDRDPDGCTHNLKLLTRTATNTYFPQVLTVISLPAEDDELTKRVSEIIGELANVENVSDVTGAKRFNSKVAATLGGYSDADIFERLQRLRAGAAAEVDRVPKLAEFNVFACGRPTIGTNDATAKLYAETLPREAWAQAGAGVDLALIKALVVVHRLREVSCLYGFTRFEAAPSSTDGDIEDISLAVRGAPISRDADWLPAVEQFGEGLFIHFDEAAIAAWLQERAAARHEQLLAGYRQWAGRFGARPPRYPSTPYVLLHSLSHALMAEIALHCGYPASSLKERIYALGAQNGCEGCGILIYTASAGAQGTLGGLTATASQFATILRSALDRLLVCSNDPICADHEPGGQGGDRATHGAACHACLLIAETSCESRNLFLDRALLVDTMSGTRFACFEVTP